MNYYHALETFNKACELFLNKVENSSEFFYTENNEGKVGFTVNKEKQQIEFFANDIRFIFDKNKNNYYCGERINFRFSKSTLEFMETDPYCLLLIGKAFLDLGTPKILHSLDNTEELNKFVSDKDSTDGFRLACMQMAKGLDDLHGFFFDPNYGNELYKNNEAWAEEKRREEADFWDEMAAVGVTPEDVYD